MTTRPVCEQCGRDVTYWSNLIQEDDGAWRCSSCRMAMLQAMKSWPGQRCTMLGCDKTAKDHIAEFRRIVMSSAWRERFASQREPGDDDVPFR